MGKIRLIGLVKSITLCQRASWQIYKYQLCVFVCMFFSEKQSGFGCRKITRPHTEHTVLNLIQVHLTRLAWAAKHVARGKWMHAVTKECTHTHTRSLFYRQQYSHMNAGVHKTCLVLDTKKIKGNVYANLCIIKHDSKRSVCADTNSRCRNSEQHPWYFGISHTNIQTLS